MATASETRELKPTTDAAAAAADAATSTSSERPTLLVAIDGQMLSGPDSSGSLSSVGSSSTAVAASATSPSFLPEMPQWKKDLIQRRKSNVARTMGAAIPMTPTSPQQRPAASQESAAGGDGWPSSPTKDYSSNAATVIQMLNIAEKTATAKVHRKQQPHAASQQNNAFKSITTTTKALSPRTETSMGGEFQKNAKTILTKKTPAPNSPTKVRAATSPYPKPTSSSTTSSSSSSAASSASSTPTKRKVKRSTGGHSPLATASNEENVRIDHRSGDLQAGNLGRQSPRQHASKTTTTTGPKSPSSSPKKSPTKSTAPSIPIPKQRSLFLAGGATETAAAASKSHAKEINEEVERQQPQQEPVSSATAGSRHASEKRVVSSAAAATIRTRSTGSALVRERTAAAGAAAEMHETETTRKQSTCGTNSPMQSTTYTEHEAQQSLLLPHSTQSHSRNESERSSTQSSDARSLLTVDIAKTVIQPTAAAVVCGGKISTKLQNNQFIKNQKTTTATTLTPTTPTPTSSGGGGLIGGSKYLKYKSHSVQEATSQNSTNATAPLSPGSSPTDPSSPLHSFGGACAIKKKMVAVQEMKKTTPTQSTNHLHLHHHNHHNHHVHGHTHHQRDQQMIIGGSTTCHQQQSPNGVGEEADLVDPSEDLSYGPGIVSKLRCRYLSLALRENIEKQRRHRIENMRRATSLNNLLDRDDHKDDDDDEDDEDVAEAEPDDADGIDVGVEEVVYRGRAAPERSIAGKLRLGGILKHSNEQQDAVVGIAGKKTATFKASTATNGGQRMSQSQYGSAGGGEGGSSVTVTDTPRSRHLKRGNDSLKRARSVEALLCEKSPWHFVSRHSNEANKQSATTMPGTTALTSPPTCVTIEDKINNARDRLHSGSDTMPPKRLTSIIDDTERPPPDLVKQTLKLFEATANRRGRGLSRTNGKGEVANKVANYRSIIKEQKPAIVFPKPTSPTKRAGAAIKSVARPVAAVGAADLIANPMGRKTAATAALYAGTSPHFSPTASLVSSTPFKSSATVDQSTPESVGGSAARNKLLSEESEAAESPISVLAKKLQKLNLDTDKPKSVGSGIGIGAAAGSNNVTTKETQAKQQQHQQQHQQNRRANELLEAERGEGDGDGDNKLVGGDDDDAAFVVGDGVTVTFARVDDDDKNERGDRADGAAERTDIVRERARAGATASSSASDHSDDDDDGLNSTKRVTKSALDNIAKAGTTQQFKFSNGNNAGRGTVVGQSQSQPQTQSQPQLHTAKSNSIANGSGIVIGIGSHQLVSDSTSSSLLGSPSQSPHPKSPSSDIQTSLLNVSPGKQIGIIRPLLTSGTPAAASANNQHHSQHHNQHQLQQHMDTLKQHPTSHSTYVGSGVGAAGASNVASSTHTPLTSREIEKNRINEMKKTAANAPLADNASNMPHGAHAAASTAAASHATSLDTVINTNSGKASGPSSSSSLSATLSPAVSLASATDGVNELDAVTAKNSPLWALRKKRQAPPAASAENTSMVFNFSNRKEVPDYIENDGVVFRRKRELPKPNESGFVLLGDLSLETSTDTDYDDFSMSPPSPCDVEFENANIVIDGKSSIRQKSKEATLHVHFNDSLTSTISYPSEASLIIDNLNSFNDRRFDTNADDFVNAFENLVLSDSGSPVHHHHHVAVDEIIQLPTQHSPSPATTATTTPTKNILGNLPLDYPNLTMGIMLQPQQEHPQPKQDQRNFSTGEVPPPQRPTNLPLPITLMPKSPISNVVKRKVTTTPAVSTSTRAIRGTSEAPQISPSIPTLATFTSSETFPQREQALKASASTVNRKQLPALEAKPNGPKPNRRQHVEPADSNSDAVKRREPPAPPPKYRSRVLNDFQLASDNRPANTCQTTTMIKATDTLDTASTVTDGQYSFQQRRKTPAVLNKPQYACFLQVDLEQEEKSRNAYVLRTRSNEFSHNRNGHHPATSDDQQEQRNNARNQLANVHTNGSAPLGFYTPIKAPIDSLFQLGVTRAPPNSNGHVYNATPPPTTATATQAAATATTNGNGNGVGGSGCGSIVGTSDGHNGIGGDESDSLKYLKPTDLLY